MHDIDAWRFALPDRFSMQIDSGHHDKSVNTTARPSSFPPPLILVIDDTPANLEILVEYFEDHGFRVAVAQDGEDGIQRAKLIHPDLILLDVMMPGIGGFEACRRLRASDSTGDIPVIFTTALTDTHNKLIGFSAGGVDYVTKPFQIEEVLARVNTHLALCDARKRLNEQNHLLSEKNNLLQREVVMRQNAEAELQRANDLLEERVAQRTSDLAQSNASLHTEIIERQQAQRRIQYMAHHDTLTGLPNRVLLEDRLNQTIAHARRHSNEMVALLFIDLDHFKTINDSLGHQIGDQLLQQVARRLQLCLREGDSVARLGGDEFVISLPALTGTNDAALVASKVLKSLDSSFMIDGHALHVGASIGISLFPEDGTDVQILMRAADAAMYHAKQKGRRNYQFFTSELNDLAQRRMIVTNQLRHALAQNEFEVYYQPQVKIDSGEIFSAEALLRLNLPGREPVSCAEFISIAEETGLILPIGEWVLREACAQLKRWRNNGHASLRIAVNLSVRQFFQQNLGEVVANVLSEFDLPADTLELEITESVLMHPNQDNMAILRQLSEMGVQLSIDDFGTGYSSLAYLQQFPINSIKIDRSFVTRISNNEDDAAIVTAIIAMAHSLHLKVIAEGVDTYEQALFLKAHGCMAAQGFYYSKPVRTSAFTSFLENRSSLPVNSG